MTINNNDIRLIIPQEIIYKLENPIIFKDLNDKQIEGFDARTLPLFAFHLWEAFLQKKIKESHTYYNEAKQAGNIVKAFATKGIIKHLLSIRRNAGQTLYAFIKESGQPTFFRHFGAIMQIMKNSKNPRDLERNFYIDFPLCIPNSTLTLFPNDFESEIEKIALSKKKD